MFCSFHKGPWIEKSGGQVFLLPPLLWQQSSRWLKRLQLTSVWAPWRSLPRPCPAPSLTASPRKRMLRRLCGKGSVFLGDSPFLSIGWWDTEHGEFEADLRKKLPACLPCDCPSVHAYHSLPLRASSVWSRAMCGGWRWNPYGNKMCEIVWIFPPYRCLSCSVAGIGSDARLRKNPIFVIEIGARMGVCSIPRSCSTLWDPMDCSVPGSSAHGIFQPRILEWVAISSSRGSSRPRDQTCSSCSSCIDRRAFYHWATWEAHEVDGSQPNAILTISFPLRQTNMEHSEKLP